MIERPLHPFCYAVAAMLAPFFARARASRRQRIRDMGRWADDGGPA